VLALFMMPQLGWRWLLGVAAFPVAVSFLLVLWLPESPRWLVQRKRFDEASAILLDVARQNRVTLPPFRLVSTAGDRSLAAAAANDKPRLQILQLFHPVLRRVTLTMWLIWPISVIAYYGIVLLTPAVFEAEARGERCFSAAATMAPSLYAKCVKLTVGDFVSIMIESAFEVPGVLITVFLIDRLGRRRTAAIEYAVMGVCMLLMIPCWGRVFETGVLAVARAMIIGAFQCAYVYTPEVYPAELRATALGTAMSVSRVGAMAAPFLAQYLAAESLLATFLVFAALLFAASIAWYSLPFETTGQRLFESIAELELFVGGGGVMTELHDVGRRPDAEAVEDESENEEHRPHWS
jgi:MFS family permease